MKIDNEDILKKVEEYKEKSSKLIPTLTSVILEDGTLKQYAQFNRNSCNLCKSPYREEAEKMFLETRAVDPVRKFLNSKGGDGELKDNWHWTTVNTHMKEHVDFTPISIDYIKKIEQAREEYINIEREPISYAKTICINMMQELKSLDLSKNLDKLMEVNKVVNSLLNTYKSYTSLEYEISGLREETEKVIMDMANRFTEIMANLMEKIQGQENKEVLKDSIKDFQAFLKLRLDKMG